MSMSYHITYLHACMRWKHWRSLSCDVGVFGLWRRRRCIFLKREGFSGPIQRTHIFLCPEVINNAKKNHCLVCWVRGVIHYNRKTWSFAQRQRLPRFTHNHAIISLTVNSNPSDIPLQLITLRIQQTRLDLSYIWNKNGGMPLEIHVTLRVNFDTVVVTGCWFTFK